MTALNRLSRRLARAASVAVVATMAFGTAGMLAGCNTTAGVGKDISSGGHWITNQANEDK
jgi:predicted small secreted protein